ncbi:hypothetical protein ACHAQH_009205 [Verticillium albo-atrum]
MGLFSRKEKVPKVTANSKPSINTSEVSVHSGASSLKSPPGTTRGGFNRGSGTSTNPNTPLTPFSPVSIPKLDLPRPPDPQLDPAGYLRSLGAIRERSQIVTDKALRNELNHFDVDLNKFPDVVSFVAGIIKRDYDAPFTSIPGHGRHQHFCVGGRDRIAHLLSTFPDDVDNTEKCRRMIDLFLVSVLLDAGAGTQWSYKSTENNRIYRRSEGIAVASLEMFKSGMFSSDKSNKYQVDTDGLLTLTPEKLAAGLQSKPGNEMAGVQGRTQLLIRLADALEKKPEFFGGDGRPGRMVGVELLTGLPEYRNGGLFVDTGVLTLKPDDVERGLQNYADHGRKTGVKGVEVAPMFEPSDDVIVEWRGVTVGFLDKLLIEVNKYLRKELGGSELTLAQLLEAGSWKGGREIAEVSRPNTKEPPILIDSDGTVF